MGLDCATPHHTTPHPVVHSPYTLLVCREGQMARLASLHAYLHADETEPAKPAAAPIKQELLPQLPQVSMTRQRPICADDAV